MKVSIISRRDFLTKSSIGLVGTGAGLITRGMIGEDSRYNKNIEQPKIKEYRVLGRTGFKVSDIGCGPALMTNENLLKAVIDSGINIIDTAEFYGNGNNESLVGRGIKGFDRRSLFVNTKLMISDKDKSEMIVNRVRKCLERLNTDYLDGLMLWNPESVDNVSNKEFHKAFNQLKKEERVKFCGISCHGTEYYTPKDSMEKIICTAVEDGRFDHVLFVFNYAQQEMGNNILKECAKKNIGVTLMKTDPFGKRYLDIIEKVKSLERDNKVIDDNTKKSYEKITEKQKKGKAYLAQSQLNDESKRRAAAINFVLNNPTVSSALISFSNFDEIPHYVNLSGGKLTSDNLSTIKSSMENYGNLYCRHACGICETSCPYGVPINTIARYNHYFISQKREKYAIQKYMNIIGSRADKCLNCEGYCEVGCPYGVSTKTLLTIANDNLNLKIT
jgi:aryl-alcohol dehydrogenase-like predicted oxidoreductase